MSRLNHSRVPTLPHAPTGFITPNGIAFSPDARRLYVSDTYSGKAWWYVMDMKDDGTVEAPRLLCSASDMAPGTEM
eukprot:23858-Eustigmatos_ZCMA.PRE.1